ncbi:DUF5682 family protein [Actinophytocola algeriensis]|uniref:Uncharacterized protein n=1 Tax=Actinophytocola algeriensis TaxID=1768010 RepID=A0A7W7QEP5_9PSEU|nr:DUF5682 family protein [Actinophytocola algeriensis]MBB4912276.1 hypothetical protein [Actinophytocola algeriensis]MBE1474208.1 hypothetical protein [Actinophytocola algeriensis]
MAAPVHAAPVHVIGVRHHSPACARLVRETIAAHRPAHVLIEGPADFSGRIGELLLGHTPPVAIFSYVRDATRNRLSWAPFCDYSPEWIALTDGHAAGADVRFIDLPCWRASETGAKSENVYADAERRYAEASERLCRAFAVDNVDVLWDHLVEAHPHDGLAERLATYFDLVRGEADAGREDTAREEYMARWIAAAAARDDGPVVAVVGGFHRPALLARLATAAPDPAWPEVPDVPADTEVGSYLVPYSNRRLDAFTGYASGMPSPGYYQRLWESGQEDAATGLVADVVTRLRARRQPVSTADLISAKALGVGLAALRGHPHPARTDVLDGLVSALVSDALEQPLPWSARGPLTAGAHPVVVEMVAALTGDRTGRLHPDTPAPPLVGAVAAELAALGLDGDRDVRLDLTDGTDLYRSRVLHRLRVLGIPGVARKSGPSAGRDASAAERWQLTGSDHREAALIEAAARGGTLPDAAAATLAALADGRDDVGALAGLLYDAALCGLADLAGDLTTRVAAGVRSARELGPLGAALRVALGLWRHDRLLGTAGSPLLGAVVTTATTRALWLAEGVRGGDVPAEPARLRALAAVRDAVRDGGAALDLDRATAVGVGGRLFANQDVPPDLRGAGLGLCWALGEPVAAADAVPRSPSVLGDWLAGLFAVAREEVLADDGLTSVLDELVSALSAHDFLVALPALRQAFEFFPPAERERFATALVARRGGEGSGRALLRVRTDPVLVAGGAAIEEAIDEMLTRAGLADL